MVNPFPGLRPFDIKEFESFFGRDKQVDELLGRLRDHRFVAVVGLSGSGKSSLVRAGLIHRLKVGHLTVAGSRWHIALMRPGSKPIAALAAVLDETLGPAPDRTQELSRSTQELLHSTRKGRDPKDNLLVVVDQFEEIFRYQREELISQREAAHFVDLLLAAEQDLSPDFRVYIVLTMRTDFLGDCAQFDGLPEALNRSQYLVPRLTRDEMREAIVGPAALADTEVSPDLLQTLLVESFDRRDPLPLLQHLLMRLWDLRETTDDGGAELKLAGYQKLGGIALALNDHADYTLAQLSSRAQFLARRIFQELTEVGYGRDQRRPMRLSALAKRTGGEISEVTAIVEHFLTASFLTSPDRGHDENWEVDISHESLIRQWDTLREWTREEAADSDDFLYFAKRVQRGAELLTGEDLILAHKWRSRGRNMEWASRYGGDFEATVAFIEASSKAEELRHQEKEDRLRREEDQRKNELRRARKLQVIFGALSFLFLGLLIFAVFSYHQATRSTHEAKARELATFASESASREPERAILLAMQALGATMRYGEPPLPVAEDALHHALLMSRVELTLHGHSGPVYSISFSADGKRLATASADQTAKVWNADSGKDLLTLRGHTGAVRIVAFSSDGRRLATASYDGTAKVWDAESGRELLTLRGHSGPVYSISFSTNGKRLATASADQTAKVWDAESGKELLTLRGHTGRVSTVEFSPDGKRLATASSDETARVWDAESGKELLTIRSHSGLLSTVTFSPDGKRLATADDQAAEVWDAASGQELLKLSGHAKTIYSVEFSPDGKRLATASEDQTAKVWDADGQEELLTLRGHWGPVSSVAFSPDGHRLATSSEDGTAKVWNVGSGKEFLTLLDNAVPVYSVVLSPDGKRIATASANQTAKVWDAENGKELLTLRGHTGAVRTAAFSPDGKWLATASDDHTAKIWDANSGVERITLRGHSGEVYSIAFSPDSKRVATAGYDREVIIWDALNGRKLLTMIGDSNWVNSVAFSPNGKLLATAGEDKTARIWDAENGKKLMTLEGHSGIIFSVVFSSDSKRLATASADRTVKVWEVVSGKELLTLSGHADSVRSVAFSPDGERLATASEDQTAKVWDSKNGDELLTLGDHMNDVMSVGFSPDGKRLATSSYDGSIQIYAIDAHDLLQLAKSRVTRDLTPDECRRYFQRRTCPALP
jgi:WD40 repeat protein/energy-coupling factor transporter ATP-binding protein EcfA2